MREKFEGAVLGAAIGDALGTLVEDMTDEQVKEAYGGEISDFKKPSASSPCPHLPEGSFSHETQMFLMVLEMYAFGGEFDRELYMQKLLKWAKDEKSHRYPSGAHLNVAFAYERKFEDFKVKSSEIDVAIPGSAAAFKFAGSAERSYQEGAQIVYTVSVDESAVDVGGLSAAALSVVLAGFKPFLKEEKLQFLELLLKLSQSPLVRNSLERLYWLVDDEEQDIERAILSLGNGTFAPEAFSMALFIFLKYPTNFKECVLNAVNSYWKIGGDTDAIAFLSGMLCGGCLGVNAIPESWLSKLEKAAYLKKLADMLYKRFWGD